MRSADRPGRTRGQNYRIDLRSLLLRIVSPKDPEKTPVPTAPVLVICADSLVLAGCREIVTRALAEIDHQPWDVLSLTAAPSAPTAELLPGRAVLGRRESGNSGTALLLHPRALARVGELLACDQFEDQTDPVGCILDAAAASDDLMVLAVEPSPFSIPALSRFSIQAPLRYRYERPAR